MENSNDVYSLLQKHNFLQFLVVPIAESLLLNQTAFISNEEGEQQEAPKDLLAAICKGNGGGMSSSTDVQLVCYYMGGDYGKQDVEQCDHALFNGKETFISLL